MRLNFSINNSASPRVLIRRCGYGEIVNREGQISYIRVFGPSGYPRFHAYLDKTQDDFSINLHLDQKKPSYGGQTAHSGEYDGKVVEAESNRIAFIIQKFASRSTAFSERAENDKR